MWIRAFLYWWPIPLFHAFNVLGRELFLEDYLGVAYATQVSVILLIVFVIVYTWLSIIKMHPSGLKSSLKYGSLWMAYTVVAMIIINIVLGGFHWNNLLMKFNFEGFPYWLIIFLSMFFMPPVMYLLRRKAIHI